MAVKFLEIVEDPFTNTSNEFVLILSQNDYGTPGPSAPGNGFASSGALEDPNGVIVGYIWLAAYQDYVVAGSLSDEAFAHAYVHDQKTMLVPPGYTYKTFSGATALQGTLEELAPFIKGM